MMHRKIGLPRLAAALAASGLAAAALSGCSFSASTGVTVAKADLEKNISEQLAKENQKPQTVSCKEDLKGEVGKSARCEVVMSSDNSFDIIATATKVEGTTVSYDMLPAESKVQLDRDVAKMIAGSSGVTVSASCESGLDGKQGAETKCDVTSDGVTTKRTIVVTKVDGLMISLSAVPMLGKAQVEGSLLDQLTAQLGSRPDSATCTDNLEGKVGNAISCTVVAGSETQNFDVTVTEVNGDNINFSYKPAT